MSAVAPATGSARSTTARRTIERRPSCHRCRWPRYPIRADHWSRAGARAGRPDRPEAAGWIAGERHRGGELLFEWQPDLGALAGERAADGPAGHRDAPGDNHSCSAADRRPGGWSVEVTDGTAEYNAEHFRESVFYDLAKNAVIRMAWRWRTSCVHTRYGGGRSPGWLRREMMLEHFGSRGHWRDALVREPHFCILGVPGFVGRGSPRSRRPRGGALERPSLVQRSARQVYDFTDLDAAARCLALHRRGSRRRQARRRDRLREVIPHYPRRC